VESRSFTAVCFGNRAAAYKALGQITDAIADCNLAIALDGRYLKVFSLQVKLIFFRSENDITRRDKLTYTGLNYIGLSPNKNEKLSLVMILLSHWLYKWHICFSKVKASSIWLNCCNISLLAFFKY